jgi:hypothetical protein
LDSAAPKQEALLTHSRRGRPQERRSRSDALNSRVGILLILPFLSPIAACFEERTPDVPVYDVEDIPVLSLTEELRLGDELDPDVGFSNVLAMDVDREGYLYVLDQVERRVRVYDQGGTRNHTIGRPGHGPGEFSAGVLMLGTTGDTLWVADFALHRTTLFTREGSVLATVTSEGVFENVAGLSMIHRPGPLRSDGRFNALLSHSIPRSPLRDTLWVPRLVFDRDGKVVDTLRFDPLTFRDRPDPIMVAGQRVTPPSAPDDRALRLTTPDDGFVVVDRRSAETPEAANVTVSWLSRSDDTLAHVALRYRPRVFDAATIDSLVWSRVRLYERRGLDPTAVASALAEGLELPPFHPPVSVAVLGHDGSVVMRREFDATKTLSWIIVAPDATVRGTFELDRSATVLWAGGEVLWVLELDQFDIPWLVKYRIGS